MKQTSLFFRRFCQYLCKYLPLMLILCAVAAVSAYLLYLYAVPPKYMARASLFLTYKTQEDGKLSTDESDYVSALELSNSFVAYMDEPFLFERAAEQLPEGLKGKYTAEQLLKATSVSVDNMTVCFRFQVLTENAEDSLALCSFLAPFALKTVTELTYLGSYQWSETPYIDEFYVSSRALTHAGFAAAVTIVLCLLIALLRVVQRNAVLSEETVLARYRFRYPSMGTVPDLRNVRIKRSEKPYVQAAQTK